MKTSMLKLASLVALARALTLLAGTVILPSPAVAKLPLLINASLAAIDGLSMIFVWTMLRRFLEVRLSFCGASWPIRASLGLYVISLVAYLSIQGVGPTGPVLALGAASGLAYLLHLVGLIVVAYRLREVDGRCGGASRPLLALSTLPLVVPVPLGGVKVVLALLAMRELLLAWMLLTAARDDGNQQSPRELPGS